MKEQAKEEEEVEEEWGFCRSTNQIAVLAKF